jgi:uncharacterized alkaline shock family protein YloU
MAISKKTPLGQINISPEAIGQLAATAALSSYGVIGIAEKSLLIGETSTKPLKAKDYNKGVFVKIRKNAFVVDLYLVCAYGVKITEIVTEVQKKVKYDLEKKFSVTFPTINVFIQAIKTN